MLAEIYLLQLEAIARTTKDLAPVSNTPFVPVTLPQTARSRDNSGPPVATADHQTALTQHN